MEPLQKEAPEEVNESNSEEEEQASGEPFVHKGMDPEIDNKPPEEEGEQMALGFD